MKVAVMQPYFFPYLGYWQMLNAVDKFVILDDVNYIKRGYINSNSILINGMPHKFTIPLDKPSQNKLINETKLNFPNEQKADFLKMIQLSYKKAPQFSTVYPMIEQIIYSDIFDLTDFIADSFLLVKNYLGIKTDILISSKIHKNNNLRAESRIIEINKQLHSNTYINAIGGQQLYNADDFSKEGIVLKFIKMNPVIYKQYNNEFVPNLSFIDVLMFNDINNIKRMLQEYILI